MNFRKHPWMIVVTVMGLAFAGLALAIVRYQWLYSCALAPGVWIVQTPFEHTYSLYTPKGRAVEDVFGWVVRKRYLYGSCGQISYFLIDLKDFKVTRFGQMWELSDTLETKGLPIYDMNHEENTSHLKYGKRKY